MEDLFGSAMLFLFGAFSVMILDLVLGAAQ
jgi:hypothetical protein